MKRHAKSSFAVVLLACVGFLAIAWWGTSIVPVGHEELSTFPSHGTKILSHSFERAPSCADDDPPRIVRSDARPMLSLCADGLTLPVLIAPYMSGVPYWHALATWPLHNGNAFKLRRVNLMSGILALLVAVALVRRVAGSMVADSTAIIMAASSPFLFLHILLLQYESLPWTLVGIGLLILLRERDRDAPPRVSRAAIAGLLWGLSIVANIKALFFAGPILFAVWRTKPKAGASRRHVLVGLGAFAASASLLPLFNFLHAGRGLQNQTESRLAVLVRPTSLSDVALEFANMVRFASDTGSYSTRAWELNGWTGACAAAVVGAAALYAIVHAVRAAFRPASNPLIVAIGVLVLEFIVISLKLYDQVPGANYAPLYGAFAAMVALAICAVANQLARWRLFRNTRVTALVLSLLAAAPLAANAIQRIQAAAAVDMSFNASAERSVVDYLLSNPRPNTRLFTTTYNLAGVMESLSEGKLHATRLDQAVYCQPPGGPIECLKEKWKTLLASDDILPARFVLATSETLSDEQDAAKLLPALRAAAREANLTFTLQHAAKASAGVHTTAVVLVEAPAAGGAP